MWSRAQVWPCPITKSSTWCCAKRATRACGWRLTLPDTGSSSPSTIFNTVLFPLPLAPTSAMRESCPAAHPPLHTDPARQNDRQDLVIGPGMRADLFDAERNVFNYRFRGRAACPLLVGAACIRPAAVSRA